MFRKKTIHTYTFGTPTPVLGPLHLDMKNNEYFIVNISRIFFSRMLRSFYPFWLWEFNLSPFSSSPHPSNLPPLWMDQLAKVDFKLYSEHSVDVEKTFEFLPIDRSFRKECSSLPFRTLGRDYHMKAAIAQFR